jgi:hypothetical protein
MPPLSNEAWLTITLSCLTVALSILGVVIAVAAVWGFASIKSEARSIAEAVSHKRVSDLIRSEQIMDTIKAEVKKRVSAEADQLYADFQMAGAFPKGQGEVGPPMGETYPAKGD